jgi:hypothetical protein
VLIGQTATVLKRTPSISIVERVPAIVDAAA